MFTCSKLECPSRVRVDRPLLFDSLAWIMMLFLFALLAMVWTTLDHMQKKQIAEWDNASKQRALIRDDNLRQEQEIATITLKLQTAPADVMNEVQQIKSILLENR